MKSYLLEHEIERDYVGRCAGAQYITVLNNDVSWSVSKMQPLSDPSI